MLSQRLFCSGIILLLTITFSYANSIDGVWEVNNSRDLVEIRSTNYGLKAKFVNSNEWVRYERIRNNIFEDRKGNRYYVKTQNRLTWESRDGRRVINLEKSRNRNGRYGNSSWREDQYDYNRRGRSSSAHVCSASCGASCAHAVGRYDDGFSGTWLNRWRDIVAYVEYDGYNVRMRTNTSGKWSNYRRTSARKLIFEDQWGNRIRFKNNGRLEWRRADNRRRIDFTRELF